MDWISIKSYRPKEGQKIWGKGENGEAVLGTFGVYHGYSHILLDPKGRSVILWSLKEWATYEVIY